IGFASYMLAYAFFALCTAYALKGDKKVFVWSSLCGLIIAGLAITGTRTTFLTLAVGFAFLALYGSNKSIFRRVKRGVKVLFVLAGLAVIGTTVLVSTTSVTQEYVTHRLKLLTVVF